MVTFLVYVASALVSPRYLTDVMSVCVCVWQEVRERENLLKPLSNWKSQTTEMPGGRWQPGFRQRVPQAESEHSVQKSVFGDLTTPVRSDLFYESVV